MTGSPISSTDPKGLLKRNFGFYDDDWQAVQNAEAKIREELKKTCSCPKDPTAGSCIPCDRAELLLDRIEGSYAIYDPHLTDPKLGTEICAKGRFLGWYVTFGDKAFGKQCTCLAATLYHELLHETGMDDDTPTRAGAGAYEKRCMDTYASR